MADPKDDPELQKTKDDTLQIFVEYARLLSQKSSSEKDSKCSEERCPTTETDSSPTAAEVTALPQLTRSKSRDAGKDLHPKRVLSVRPLVVDGHHCRVGADAKQSGLKSPSPLESSAEAASNPISSPLAPPVSSAVKSARPDTHRRNPSLHSTDISTQAQDPPMDPVLSPVADFTMSYPPPIHLPLQGANSPVAATAERREGLVQSAEHARSVAEPSSKIPSRVAHERPRELAAASPIVDSDPRGVKARKIADRLKEIGDNVEDERLRSNIEEFIRVVGDAVTPGSSPAQVMYTLLCRSELSWRKVVEIFKALCYVIKYDDQFSTFEKVWYCLLDNIIPWIQDNGGWGAFLRANSSGCHANTPNVVRRHPVPAQSEPVLPGCATPTCSRHPRLPSCIQVADGRNTIGRMAFTPQMSRPSRREQSSPCLCQSYQQATPTMSEASSRHRLWSLTERGSFQNEDGEEDIERSISEFDMEDDTFDNSQEEEREEEEEEPQDGERTLTSSTLRRTLTSLSTPITVPSPHSCSQPDHASTDDLHSDSGIENLSLSCSPPRVGFSVGGGVGHRHSPMLLARNQTSLTSLSSAASAASASPVHTSPSSRKNSSSNGTFNYNGKARPRSSGSFKESSHRQGNEGTSSFYRTGSLNRQHPRVATPTNTTPTRFGGSHHASWREDINVRRVSTTAYEMYQQIKAFFDSP